MWLFVLLLRGCIGKSLCSCAGFVVCSPLVPCVLLKRACGGRGHKNKGCFGGRRAPSCRFYGQEPGCLCRSNKFAHITPGLVTACACATVPRGTGTTRPSPQSRLPCLLALGRPPSLPPLSSVQGEGGGGAQIAIPIPAPAPAPGAAPAAPAPSPATGPVPKPKPKQQQTG
jgi:hypothetical protein